MAGRIAGFFTDSTDHKSAIKLLKYGISVVFHVVMQHSCYFPVPHAFDCLASRLAGLCPDARADNHCQNN